MAGRPGFEPGFPGPEPRVLPLNYLPKIISIYQELIAWSSMVLPDIKLSEQTSKSLYFIHSRTFHISISILKNNF